MEGNDTHGGHGRICEGDRARVGVTYGMVEVNLYGEILKSRNGMCFSGKFIVT